MVSVHCPSEVSWGQLGGESPHPGRPNLSSVYFHIDWTECARNKRDTSTKEVAIQKQRCPA